MKVISKLKVNMSDFTIALARLTLMIKMEYLLRVDDVDEFI